MRLIKKIQKTEEVIETVDILCNMCGKTLHDHPSDLNYYGIEELVVDGGFGSPHIGDMKQIRFSICEPCLYSRVLNQFIIPHEIKSIDLYAIDWTSAPECDAKEAKVYEDQQQFYAELLEKRGHQ